MEKKSFIKDIATGYYFYTNDNEGGFTDDLGIANSYDGHSDAMMALVNVYLRNKYLSGKTLEIVEYFIIF